MRARLCGLQARACDFVFLGGGEGGGGGECLIQALRVRASITRRWRGELEVGV
jgi:hypothetical protein